MLPKRRLLSLLFFGIVLILAAACDTGGDEVVIPTEFILPSFTPSDTPSPTNTPTQTLTPTNTSTLTNTPTFTPTSSSTPTWTFTPSITATHTLTPTFTATNTPLATNTPTPTLTPVAPQILTFTASATTATVGQIVNLTWQAQADQARIEQLNSQGAIVQTFSVTPTGVLPVTIPTGQGTLVVYRLVAARNQIEVSASVSITVSCPIAWFFGNEFATQPGTGCPTGAAIVGGGAYQEFERGVGIFLDTTQKVYGIQQEGQRYLGYNNGWDGVTIYDSTNCGGLSAPGAPLLFPEGYFGWMYCTTLGSGGTWNGLLGWATTGIDGTQRTFQTSDTNVIFIDAPGGGIYRLSGGDSGTWLKVK